MPSTRSTAKEGKEKKKNTYAKKKQDPEILPAEKMDFEDLTNYTIDSQTVRNNNIRAVYHGLNEYRTSIAKYYMLMDGGDKGGAEREFSKFSSTVESLQKSFCRPDYMYPVMKCIADGLSEEETLNSVSGACKKSKITPQVSSTCAAAEELAGDGKRKVAQKQDEGEVSDDSIVMSVVGAVIGTAERVAAGSDGIQHETGGLPDPGQQLQLFPGVRLVGGEEFDTLSDLVNRQSEMISKLILVINTQTRQIDNMSSRIDTLTSAYTAASFEKGIRDMTITASSMAESSNRLISAIGTDNSCIVVSNAIVDRISGAVLQAIRTKIGKEDQVKINTPTTMLVDAADLPSKEKLVNEPLPAFTFIPPVVLIPNTPSSSGQPVVPGMISKISTLGTALSGKDRLDIAKLISPQLTKTMTLKGPLNEQLCTAMLKTEKKVELKVILGKSVAGSTIADLMKL